MNVYTYYAEGLDLYARFTASTEREAFGMAWNSLDHCQKDCVSNLDLVDVEVEQTRAESNPIWNRDSA